MYLVIGYLGIDLRESITQETLNLCAEGHYDVIDIGDCSPTVYSPEAGEFIEFGEVKRVGDL